MSNGSQAVDRQISINQVFSIITPPPQCSILDNPPPSKKFACQIKFEMCILNILKAAEFGYIVLLVVQEESKHVLDSTQLTGKVALWSELLTCCVKWHCIKDRPPLNIPQSGPRPATSCSSIPCLHTTHITMYTGRYWYRINQYNGTLVQCY